MKTLSTILPYQFDGNQWPIDWAEFVTNDQYKQQEADINQQVQQRAAAYWKRQEAVCS